MVNLKRKFKPKRANLLNINWRIWLIRGVLLFGLITLSLLFFWMQWVLSNLFTQVKPDGSPLVVLEKVRLERFDMDAQSSLSGDAESMEIFQEPDRVKVWHGKFQYIEGQTILNLEADELKWGFELQKPLLNQPEISNSSQATYK